MAPMPSRSRVADRRETSPLPERLRSAAIGGGTGLPTVLRGLCSALYAGSAEEDARAARDIAVMRARGIQPLGAPLVSEAPLGRIRHHPGRLAATITACARFGGSPPAGPRRGQ